jgi:hypothetical protein
MIKRGLIFGILIVLSLFVMHGISATTCTNNSNCGSNEICNASGQCVQDTSQITASSSEETKINKAYECLSNKVKDSCPSSLEENVFVSLALGECTDKISSDSKFKSDVKLTALAIIALGEAGSSTSDAERWLISQNTTPTDVDWFLQIDSSEQTSCSIAYSGSSYAVDMGEDKKLSSNAGNCLSLSEGSYWMRVSPSCYDQNFEVSCNKGFQTNLLFKKTTSSTIYVSDKTTAASAEGKTIEKVRSLCFRQGSSCDYEASLWAAMALKYKDYEVSDYIPYLVTMAEDNEKFLPDSFLYYLTGSGDYRSSVLLKQISSKYWDVSQNKFYDTALALYPFQFEDPAEKTNAISWLLEVQDADGCWKGSIRDTAFLLHSIWPRENEISPPGELDCSDNHGFCMSEANCEGKILNTLSCPGIMKCCDVKETLKTCLEEGGKKCASNEICSNNEVDASDGKCCIGTCSPPAQETECEQNSGTCRAFGCNDNEQTSSSYSCDFQDTCCVQKTTSGGISWWIWVLIALIVLVVLGIIFREKLKIWLFRIKSGFGKSSGVQRPSINRGPPRPPMMLPRAMPLRRIIPSSSPTTRFQMPQKSKGEIDEVLKKLRDMGK